MTPAGRPPTPSRGAYDVFRPRRGAWVAWGAAIAVVVVFVVLAVALPSVGIVSWGTPDRVMLGAFGLALALGLTRFTRLRAEPSPQGLRVVNLVQTHDLEWSEVLQVGFSGGAPWAVLELTDTEQVAVMAIQRADGEYGRAEAARLSALVEHHSRGPQAP